MQIKTIEDIPEIQGKRILMRVDFNTPLTEPDENGHREVKDNTRIVEALPTINFLLEKGARLILLSHLGRPKGQIVDELRLDPIARELAKLLPETEVQKSDAITSDHAHEEVQAVRNGEILILENVRFRAEEEECTTQYTKELASLGDIYVNDAFGTAHRRHSSTAGLADHLPAYGGFLMQKEVSALAPLLENPTHPLTLVLGGAKIDTKIGIIKTFIGKADHILVGGGIGNTFLTASGYNLGESLVQHDKVELAREIMMECQEHHTKIIVPHDLVAASEATDDAETADVPVEDFIGDMKAFDLGKWSTEKFCNIITESKTVVWNGPVGMFEKKAFQAGSRTIANCIAKHECTSIIGGGDTINAIKDFNIPVESFTHLSTGGGASLEFLEGKTLPGIKALMK
jgi:phosphoglycerate kinase